jgi:hypothetical protein
MCDGARSPPSSTPPCTPESSHPFTPPIAGGAIAAFLYMVFGLSSRQYNAYRFNQQVRGLDIRKLDRGQFTPFGRLIDKSFQMPREFQCMTAD